MKINNVFRNPATGKYASGEVTRLPIFEGPHTVSVSDPYWKSQWDAVFSPLLNYKRMGELTRENSGPVKIIVKDGKYVGS